MAVICGINSNNPASININITLLETKITTTAAAAAANTTW